MSSTVLRYNARTLVSSTVPSPLPSCAKHTCSKRLHRAHMCKTTRQPAKRCKTTCRIEQNMCKTTCRVAPSTRVPTPLCKATLHGHEGVRQHALQRPNTYEFYCAMDKCVRQPAALNETCVRQCSQHDLKHFAKNHCVRQPVGRTIV